MKLIIVFEKNVYQSLKLVRNKIHCMWVNKNTTSRGRTYGTFFRVPFSKGFYIRIKNQKNLLILVIFDLLPKKSGTTFSPEKN